MKKIVDGPETKQQLPALLEGYLYGLGEVCHTLFGSEGEEEQGAWERGTPPCPLWSIILHSLSEINYTIVLDSVAYNKKWNGYESTFHFKKITAKDKDVLARAKKTIRSALIPICASCKKIRDENGNWVSNDEYFTKNYDANFSHGICPVCYEKLYPGM